MRPFPDLEVDGYLLQYRGDTLILRPTVSFILRVRVWMALVAVSAAFPAWDVLFGENSTSATGAYRIVMLVAGWIVVLIILMCIVGSVAPASRIMGFLVIDRSKGTVHRGVKLLCNVNDVQSVVVEDATEPISELRSDIAMLVGSEHRRVKVAGNKDGQSAALIAQAIAEFIGKPVDLASEGEQSGRKEGFGKSIVGVFLD